MVLIGTKSRGRARKRPSARRTGPAARRGSPRERILGAAFAAFTARGYAAASTLEIATRAGVSKRELYALFGNKEQMLITCIAERARRMHPPATESAAPRDRHELEATLVRFGAVLLAELSDPDVVALQRLAIAEADRSPEVGRALEVYGRGSCARALREMLAGALGADADVGALVDRYLSVLLGDLPMSLALGLRRPPAGEEIERRAREAARTVSGGSEAR
jgi:AcrR family transcriptional regulator